MKRLTVAILFLLFAVAPVVQARDVQTIDKDELRKMLGAGDLVLYDVRTGRDWSSSEFKIKGALRLEDGDLAQAMAEISKEATIVLYCA